jgi:hypothetical protein
MSERPGNPPSPGGADLVSFEPNPNAGPPGATPPEEIYEPPPSKAVRAAATPPPPPPSAKPAQARETMPGVPPPSALRRSPEEARSIGRRRVLALVALGMVALGCTGIAAAGAGILWMQSRSAVAAPEPIEAGPAEPEAPPEVGGIPLENRLRKGPATAPKRPDVP